MYLRRSLLALLAALSLAVLLTAPLVLAAPSWAKKGNYVVYSVSMTMSGDQIKKAYNTDKVQISMKVKVTITSVDDDGVTVKYTVSDVKVKPETAKPFKDKLLSTVAKSEKLYFDEEFNPADVKTLVNPSTLPKNGVYTSEQNGATYKLVYDTKTGWLKEAHMESSLAGVQASLDISMVKSNFIGGVSGSSGGSSKAISIVIAIVVLAIIAIAAKKLLSK